ncbi:ectonucleotide pyrophosphatase/phosphodiesterase family member 6 [Myxococcaceae bacterium]|nr:ectonucleotide pyrophosphatase/phosphodiesterase family member 6 [Myxococcaceae bacterium]
MTSRVSGALLALVLALATSASAGEPRVILISLDGVRADTPDRFELPGLARLEREGLRAARLESVFPSITFPAHVSMASGAPVDRHGIVANAFLDPERGLFDYANDPSWQAAEPVWVTAERQGVASAVFFWVGSMGPFEGVRPRHFVAPFDASVPESEKVDRILGWLDLPPAERPRLVLSWWKGADREGHRFGPDSPAVKEAMLDQDAELRRLLEGLDARSAWGDTTLLVASDHGMAEASEPVDLRAALEERGIGAKVGPFGGIAWIALDDPSRRQAAQEGIAALPGVRAYASDALPAPWRYGPASRLGDLVAVTDAPRYFRDGTRARVASALGLISGAHGYDPKREDMGAIFFAKGRGVPPGTRIGSVSILDVAPTITRLLGIEPPRDSEGRAIDAIAAPEAR